MRRASTLALTFALTACASPGGKPPSLAPRAAESIDPRVPVVHPVDQRPVEGSVASRLAALITQARQGDETFRAALAEAERAVASAGSPRSESWVAAQQAVSAAMQARGPTVRALGDIDQLGADMLQSKGDIPPADLAAIRSAGAEVGAIDQRQAEAVDALQRRLGG